VGLGHDQRGTVLGDGHAVGECEVVGDHARGSLRSDEDDEAWCRRTAGKVEADVVDVRIAARVNHDVIPWLRRDGGEAGMGDHRPIRLARTLFAHYNVGYSDADGPGPHTGVEAHQTGLTGSPDAGSHPVDLAEVQVLAPEVPGVPGLPTATVSPRLRRYRPPDEPY
jgi:hypothetical protein